MNTKVKGLVSFEGFTLKLNELGIKQAIDCNYKIPLQSEILKSLKQIINSYKSNEIWKTSVSSTKFKTTLRISNGKLNEYDGLCLGDITIIKLDKPIKNIDIYLNFISILLYSRLKNK